jgi:hypothetical protein
VVYEDRYTNLTGRVKAMTDYMMDAEASTSQMERELAAIDKAPKVAKK